VRFAADAFSVFKGPRTMHGYMQTLRRRLSIIGLTLVAFILINPISITAPAGGSPSSRPNIKIKASTSANWSGYAVESSITSPTNGFVSSVKGNWVVPTLTCNQSQNTYVVTWVGIDGYSDGTVEQIGTGQQCVNGVQQDYAWIELYPKPSRTITGITVHDGDSFTASVTYQGSNYFALSITDLTTGLSYSQTSRTSAQRQSAEWVVEAPSSGGILPLANFSTVSFNDAQFTDNTGTTYAIDGKGLGTYDAITLNDPSGGTATPSGLTDTTFPQGPSSFSVTYHATLTTSQHDVAVADVMLSKNIIGQGYSLNVNVTAADQGMYTETFKVTVYANGTIIASQNITLSSGSAGTITFTWNTTGFAKGKYTIKAYAWPVPNEANVTNNSFVDGTVQVAKKGDLTGDGSVDVLDLIIVAEALGTHPGDPKWNPNADVNSDGVVNVLDLILVAKYLGT
jgi:hypothetical protein